MAAENTKMDRDNDTEVHMRAGSLFLYCEMIFAAIIMIALICGIGYLIWRNYNSIDGQKIFGILEASYNLVVLYIILLLLILFTIYFVVSIPETVRDILDKERQRYEKYDAIMAGYFAYNKEFRNAMLHILWLMDEEHYSSADAACVKLLEECYIPEEQAAILYCRMDCREEMGYTKEAIACGEKAISLRKGYRPALLKTAQLCIKINKMTAAGQYLLEARQTDKKM